LREEARKVEVPVPPTEEIKAGIAEAERVAPVKPYVVPVDWAYCKTLADRICDWTKRCEAWVEKRELPGVAMYLRSIQDWSADLKRRLMEAGREVFHPYEARAEPVRRVLTLEQEKKLWEAFASKLREAGVDPEPHRARFEELLAVNMPYEDNEAILMDEARTIMGLAGLRRRKYVDKLPVPPKVFSWKYVGWGLTALKMECEQLRSAIRVKDGVSAYRAVGRMLEIADKLKALVRLKLR